MSDIANDLNATITAAVQARIEASVAEALSGNQLVTQYVAAALTREVTVRDRDSYKDRKTTFLRETIEAQIKGATEVAVRKIIAEEAPAIEAAVTTELRKNVKAISSKLVGQVVEAASKSYGVSVELKYPGR